MFGMNIQELVLIFLILLLVFGGKKLPQLARGIGQGINEFRKGISGAPPEEEQHQQMSEPQEPVKKSRSKKT